VLTRNTKTGQWTRSIEIAFYISSTPITADRAAKAIRGHWRIESAPQAHTRRRFEMN
jgi:hypothetical protein